MTAVKGVYDAKGDIIRLTEGIVIRSTAGYEGRLKEALIEVKRGYVITEMPVDISFNNGTIRADRMEVFENGARAHFEGNVTMVMKLPPPENAGQQ